MELWLFSRYADELAVIQRNLLNKLGATNGTPESLTSLIPGQILDVLLPDSLLALIVQFCNSRLTQLKETETNLDEFRLCVAAYLRFAVFNGFESTFRLKNQIGMVCVVHSPFLNSGVCKL